LQVKAVIQALLGRCEVRLRGEVGRMRDVPIPHPRAGLPVELRRI
jgi:hypothetical protein